MFTGAAAAAAHPDTQRQDEVDENAHGLLGSWKHRHSSTDLLQCVQILASHHISLTSLDSMYSTYAIKKTRSHLYASYNSP